MRFASFFLLPLLGLTACTPTLEDGFGEDLTRRGGCADVMFYAVDEGDTILLSFYTQGVISAAYELGEETTSTYLLPEETIDLKVEVGQRVSDAVCDDVIENGGPMVRETWTPVSGTATLTVRPGDTLEASRADLVLEGVVFEPAEGGDPVSLGDLEILDVGVGWFPG